MNNPPANSLASLLLEARQHPADSHKRQKLVTQIIRQMQQSGKIWRDYRIGIDQYQEALQRTWVWFCQNLHNYDSTQSNLMTWFNCTLKYRIKDVMRESQIHQSQQVSLSADGTDNAIDRLPAPPIDEPLRLLTETLAWLHQERPKLEQITIRDRPDIDAYALILRRLPTPNQASWQDLSAQFDAAIPTLSSFYRRQCLPLLREFGRSQGWIDPSGSRSSGKQTKPMTNLSAGHVTESMRSA